MLSVTSTDGTTIAYECTGAGPPLVIVDGALCSRALGPSAALAACLASHFTVYTYDRRGRGESTDTQPYAVAREVEDIAVLIDAVGGSALVYGVSSGAVLALEAASHLTEHITKLALYEPALILDYRFPAVPADYIEHLTTALAAGCRGDAIDIFLTRVIRRVMPMPDEALALLHHDPTWPALEAVAHTLVYDALIMEGLQSGKSLPPGRWDTATMPALVIHGSESAAFFAHAAHILANTLPTAQYRCLRGQAHDVAADVLAPVLIAFFSA